MATAASAATCIKYNFIRSLFVLSCDLTHKSTKLQLVVCVYVCVCVISCVCVLAVCMRVSALCVWLVCAVCARWLWAGYDHGYRKFFLLVMSWLTSSLSLSYLAAFPLFYSLSASHFPVLSSFCSWKLSSWLLCAPHFQIIDMSFVCAQELNWNWLWDIAAVCFYVCVCVWGVCVCQVIRDFNKLTAIASYFRAA